MTTLRAAVVADLVAINDIFNHYVDTSTCVWAMRRSTLSEREVWLAEHHQSALPVVVAEQGVMVVGWGALSPFTTASTFHATVADSVYVHPACLRRGIGTLLLTALIDGAQRARCASLIAEISADQTACLALHRAQGFVESGRLRRVGHKFGERHDLIYLQRLLPDAPDVPSET